MYYILCIIYYILNMVFGVRASCWLLAFSKLLNIPRPRQTQHTTGEPWNGAFLFRKLGSLREAWGVLEESLVMSRGFRRDPESGPL